MIFIVPAWHKLLTDWATTTPMVSFDDATNHLQIMNHAGQSMGLLVTDYQPQLTSKLNRIAENPQKVWSVFDYLQGIYDQNAHVLDYHDLPWPADSYFHYTPFRLWVMKDGQVYAQIIFDSQSKMLNIDVMKQQEIDHQFVVDSRGFISRETFYHDGQAVKELYFNRAGICRLSHQLTDDSVTINSDEPKFCQNKHYDHLKDLIHEVLCDHFLPQLSADDRLVASVDDDATYSISDLANHPGTIYSISRWHPYRQTLKDLGQISHPQLVVDSEMTAGIVANQMRLAKAPTVLPIFQSQFKLGHSARLTSQLVTVFSEGTSQADLQKILEIEYPRLIKNPSGEALRIVMCSPAKEEEAQAALDQLKDNHDGEFRLVKDLDQKNDDDIDDFGENLAQLIPKLDIKVQRLTSTSSILNLLDKTRLLIDWGQPDDFLQFALISVGVPQLSQMGSPLLADHRNGIICHSINEIKSGLHYYLDNLKHWNQSLAYCVNYLNRYSEDQLLQRWQQLLEQGK